jgi:hypothetical protein
MDLPVYTVRFNKNLQLYHFMSIGLRGSIQKAVKFRHVRDYIFNLSFGNWDGTSDRIDDRSVSNNGDRDKILATVAYLVIDFIDLHPGSVVLQEVIQRRGRDCTRWG